MKVTKLLRLTVAFAAVATGAVLLASCTAPAYPDTDTSSNLELTAYDSLSIASLDYSVSSDFIRGADASMVYQIEKNGGVFYDEDNTQKDVLAIFKEHGVNWIRLRLWYNYKDNTNSSFYTWGENDLVATKAIAVRAKALGMKVLLDFHYSDSWADPTKQVCPVAWKSYTFDEVNAALYQYTYETLASLANAGAAPDMVQIGNEVESGLFLTGNTNFTAKSGTTNYVTLMNTASAAVRAADSSAKVMVHISRGGNSSVVTTFCSNYITNGTTTTAAVGNIDFDVLGLSYYPGESTHGTLANLETLMAAAKTTYGKDVCVAETSYGWSESAYSDSLSNSFYTDDEEAAATNLVDSSGNIVSGITTGTDGDSKTGVLGSPANQAGVVRAIMNVTAQAGGLGIFYWGGDWIGSSVVQSTWENQALFDTKGKCLPSMNVFSVSGN